MTSDQASADAKALAAINDQIEADNFALREHFLLKVSCYTEEEATAKFGLDFLGGPTVCVEHGEHRFYPQFQFENSMVMHNIQAALLLLPTNMSRWQTAFWFVSSNPWLHGKAPVERLSHLDQLLFAANQENVPIG